MHANQSALITLPFDEQVGEYAWRSRDRHWLHKDIRIGLRPQAFSARLHYRGWPIARAEALPFYSLQPQWRLAQGR